MNCSTPSFPVLHYLLVFAQTHELVMPSKHLILCCPFLLLPSIFPINRVFSKVLALRIRWPKYWSLSFNISPSSETSGLISFRINQFDLLADSVSAESLATISPWISLIKKLLWPLKPALPNEGGWKY